MFGLFWPFYDGGIAILCMWLCVCFFVLCNRHRFNRIPGAPPRDGLGVTYLPSTSEKKLLQTWRTSNVGLQMNSRFVDDISIKMWVARDAVDATIQKVKLDLNSWHACMTKIDENRPNVAVWIV